MYAGIPVRYIKERSKEMLVKEQEVTGKEKNIMCVGRGNLNVQQDDISGFRNTVICNIVYIKNMVFPEEIFMGVCHG